MLYTLSSAHIHKSMKLSELSIGQSATVTAVHVPAALRERLRMLNVAEGGRIRLLRCAPFGGGLLLEAAGVRLALRDTLAACIEVRSLGEETCG